MPARVFRRITTLFSTTSKTALLALFLFVATLGAPTDAFAQSAADTAVKMHSYLNLFTPNSGITLPSNGYLTQDATTKDVIGLKFNIDFTLDTSVGKTPEQLWSYIAEPNGSMNKSEAFVIRLCNAAYKSQCWVNTIPYRGNASNNGTETLAAITRISAGNYTPGANVQNFSAFNHNDPNNAVAGGNGYRYRFARDASGTKSEGTRSDFRILALPPGTSYEATLWYCAANNAGETGASAYVDGGHNSLGDTIATFDDLCGGNSYFRIGTPVAVTIPATVDDISKQVNGQSTTSKTIGNPDTNLPICDISLTGGAKIVGCLAQLVYYGIYWPIAWVAGFFGSLFDFFIGYSVSDESYRYAFAVTGWKLVRDISNIMFIIIMVYTGFAAVFSFGGKGGSTMKKVIPILIINALIINFSLFATRTVIDISNVTARVFYSRMVVCNGACVYSKSKTVPDNIKRSIGGYWPLSEKIVSAFDPQRMFGAVTLQPKETATGVDNPNDPLTTGTPTNTTAVGSTINAQQQKGFAQDSGEYAGYYALVSLVAAAIMLAILMMFFNVTFMFLGRVIGLYMAMIFSPFAFLTRGGMPLFNIKGYTWDSWIKDLFNYAALAPVFVFFLYIIYSFLNTDLVKEIGIADPSGSFFGTVLSIAIPMLIIYKLISKGADLAKDYAGEFGNKIQGFVSGAVGGVGGVLGGGIGLAAGAGAFLGTRFGSRIGKAVGGSKLGSWAANNADSNKAARFFNNTLSKTQTGTWDFRNTKLNSSINTGLSKASFGAVKVQDKVSGIVGLDSKNFEGGYKGQQKRRQDEIKENIKNSVQYDHLNDDQVKKLWERRQNERADEQALKNFAEIKSAAYAAASTNLQTKEADLKAKKEALEKSEKELAVKKTTLTETELAALKTAIENNKKDVAISKKDVASAKEKASEELGKVRSTDYKNDAAYATLRDEAQKSQVAKDEKEFGKIGNVADYNNAMRREYANDLRNNSLFMKDGESRLAFAGFGAGTGAGGIGAMLAGAGAAATASIAGAFGVFAEERIKFEEEAIDAATKSYIKDYGKKKGKDSKAEQLGKKIKDYEKIINEAVKDRIKDEPANIGKTDDQLDTEIKAMDNDKKGDHVKEFVDEKQAEYDARNSEYKRSEELFKDGTITRDDLKLASKARKKAEDELNKAKNVWDNKEKAETELEKENEKNKDK